MTQWDFWGSVELLSYHFEEETRERRRGRKDESFGRDEERERGEGESLQGFERERV